MTAEQETQGRYIDSAYQVGAASNRPCHGQDGCAQYRGMEDFMPEEKAPDEAMNVFMSEFDAMYEYGGLWGTVWHPFVSGRLARCLRIAKMIEEI